MQTPQFDDPEVLAEVQAAFDRYEHALVANDREALIAFFLDASTTVRYGIDDSQYGHEELAEFRRTQAIATPPRALRRPVITTFVATSRSPTPSSSPTGPTPSVGSRRPGCAPTPDGRS